ncbi:hypothetical protein ANO11243_034290 [Dothideomycetidae sp. 11243]|nr:hypothetical protein ANO11243_034290 [fungal sp. No.11243]
MRFLHLSLFAFFASFAFAAAIDRRSLISSVSSWINDAFSGWDVPGTDDSDGDDIPDIFDDPDFTSPFGSTIDDALSQIANLTDLSFQELVQDLEDEFCTNSPSSRLCWAPGYNMNQDFDNDWPSTGNVVSYTLTVTNMTLAPDGYSRMVLAVNGQYPGPTIYADWGDILQITVVNQMADNGTSMHWHGLRQFQSNPMDGVPGVSECPIAPGQSKTYTFQCTQFGTSWYHSHFAGQYGDGVVGPIVINGPATANYDVDLGPLPVTDWYYTPVQEVGYRNEHTPGAPPAAENGLVNGSMTSSHGGQYSKTTIECGKKYRIRLINMSVDNHFMVSLDGHPFTVIASDFVPIVPYTTDWLFLGIGQRYDVIITANQTIDNYWFRAEVQRGCGINKNNGNIRSIFSYDTAPATNPTSNATTYTSRCTDETQLVPFWDTYVNPDPLTTANSQFLDTAINIGVQTDGSRLVNWGINASAMHVHWDTPLLSYVYEGNTSYPASENLIQLPVANQWYYWVIQEVAGTPVTFNVPHPIHLHGHDFFILGTGTGFFNVSTDAAGLKYSNPPRRDTAMLPAGGWLVIAFETDNPGAWIMHCHISWHASEGLAVNFLESADQIPSFIPETQDYDDQCASWSAFYPAHAKYLQDDSGI